MIIYKNNNKIKNHTKKIYKNMNKIQIYIIFNKIYNNLKIQILKVKTFNKKYKINRMIIMIRFKK